MKFNQKLQKLRKQKKLTQEELAGLLFVSRTAILKWESGRGYPSIDSLKTIAEFFSVSVDELLSEEELADDAEQKDIRKIQHVHSVMFGLLDCVVAVVFFLPFFGQRTGGIIYEIPLLSLTETQWYVRASYLAIVLLTVIWGIAELALQNYQGTGWIKCKNTVSVLLSASGTLIFAAGLQSYAAAFMLMFLLIKGILLKKRGWHQACHRCDNAILVIIRTAELVCCQTEVNTKRMES